MAYNSYYDPSGPPGPYEPPRTQDTNEQIYTSPTSYQPPYPSQNASEQIQMPQPRMPSPSYRNSSPTPNNPPYGHVGNDIPSAIPNPAGNNNNPNFLSPELISQVTATVIQQLKAYGLEGSQGQQQPPPPPPPPMQQPPLQQQPPVQQPPQAQSVPPAPFSAPPAPESTYYPQPTYSAQPAETRGRATMSVPPERRETQPKTSPDNRSGSVLERNTVPARTSTDNMSTLEKIWGKMFEDGQPTPRLGQLLRGIAVHLIEDYPPGNTIVVVPEKMQKYYADTKVPTDTYPWQDIFDDRTSSISRIYRDIEAEHHLVQDPQNLKERPDVPGLTPRGFEKWYTLMIQANPDREFARLQKTVLDMPINNPDDRKERFPKELPRRLFPSSPDKKILEKLEVSIITHCEVDLPRSPPEERSKSPPRKSKPRDVSPTRPPPATVERVPATVSGSKSNSQERDKTSTALDGDEEVTTARPIERERKPYTAQPGLGKKYEETAINLKTSETNKSTSGSSTVRQEPYSRGATNTTGHGHAHHGSASSIKPGRRRSSSVGIKANGPGDYRHSEPDLSSYDPTYANVTSGGGHSTHHYKTSGVGSTALDLYDDDNDRLASYRDYERDDPRDYDAILERERERERERRYHDHLGSGTGRSTWTDEDYYRGGGLLGGQGGPDYEYKYR
ncbi:conserved hypothetical protein [Talaromyces stipitatus ATCC 10500]|uniref:DUF7514 domain-containing protein n=1 Tax=Talaromyces stipitatus (strain ATCC 10500 / CBS 375.48 / QM 6759 / NRRL 1006) TaxID=441959 RepID=B8M3M5_TALSN|nr:uncharacterized protein TSTA_096460 [Talaromyces stipitatus ATCC 10500]EED22397.1 conserved hypothetical protein [Talaromyces stipitatus ATCC 10500]